MGSVKKILLFSIIFIVIAVALILLFPSQILGIFFKDIKPIDDSDLTFEKIDVPQEQNAYYDFVSLEKEVKEGEVKYPENYTSMSECFADEKCLEEAGTANQKSFSVIDKILAKQYFVNPDYADPAGVSFGKVVYNNSEIMFVASLQPYYLLKKGKDKEALESAFKMFEISQKIKSGRPNLIDSLIGIAMEGMGTKAVEEVVNNSNFSSADLLEYSKKLAEFEEGGRQSLVLIEKAKYIAESKFVDDLHSGNFSGSDFNWSWRIENIAGEGFKETLRNNYYFQPNKTKQFYAKDARLNIQAEQSSCSSEISEENFSLRACGEMTCVTFDTSSPGLKENVKFLILNTAPRLWPNSGGLMLYDLGVSINGKTHLAGCRSQTGIVELQTLLALKAYKQDNARLPDSLDALVPDYLPEVPKDPFSGQALKYSLEKKIIYSVGRNDSQQDFIDDGGDKEKDIVVEINF